MRAPLTLAVALVACAPAPSDPPEDAGTADVVQAGDASSMPDSDAGAPVAVDLGPGGDFKAYATAAATRLQVFYDPQTGLWSGTGWWNSANALTALIDYSMATGSNAYASVVSTTFDANDGAQFLNQFYDDEGWWALAWVRAYDWTKNGRYLARAKTIFKDMTAGWDATCGGGIWWSKAKSYKNAIANELFLDLAVRLHQRTPGDAGPGSFLDWAQREWSFFDKSGMINSSHLVNDGLASCKNNGKTTWTYNQGVLIGGLVGLSDATGDAGLVVRAEQIAAAAMTKLVDDVGVLREPCEPSCGADGPQFKGIFMRHLAELAAATGDPALRVFITRNADWIWNADRNAGSQIGLTWSGSFDAADPARQSSGLDALDAAIPFSDPVANLALGKSATANGSCAADQTASKAFDGTVKTKWCSGATAGTYWLDVDLGAPTEIGRVIVRHAGAGGEDPAWNTRDFRLVLNPPALVASVSGNTRSVTIHRFDPQVARNIRLEITSAQSDPSTVAARIDELEIYPR